MSTSEARLMIAASETDADMYYATRFLAPDPFIFFQIGAEKHLLMSDLERDRARAQAQVDRVLSLSEYQEKAKKKNEEPSQIDALHEVLQEKNITHLNVPRAFAIATADDLRERGYTVAFPEGAYWPDREIKTPEEIEHIREVQQHTEAAMDAAITLIRNSEIRGDILYHNGEPLTSERVKREIKFLLLERDCTAGHTIVAGGDQACDPHNEGTGPLPRAPIHHHRHLPALKHHRLLRRPHPHRRQRRTLCRPPEHLRRGPRRTKPRPRQRPRRRRRPGHPPITHRTL